jgi:hypothetical protein
VHHLGLDAIDHLPSQTVHLFNELRSQLIKWYVSQVLELTLIGQWSDHSGTVTLLEEGFQQSSDSILLVDGLTESFLILQGLLEVVLGCDWLLVRVNQLKGEVTDHPHQRGEILGVLLGVGLIRPSTGLDLNVLSKVDDERQVVELGFIN